MHEETHTKSEKPDEDMKRNYEENYPPAKARPKTPAGTRPPPGLPHPPPGLPTSKAILDAYWNQHGPKGPDENMQDTPYERMQGPEDWKEPDLLCKEPDGVWKEPDEHCQDPDNHWNSDEHWTEPDEHWKEPDNHWNSDEPWTEPDQNMPDQNTQQDVQTLINSQVNLLYRIRESMRMLVVQLDVLMPPEEEAGHV